jgi:hypothetical protein
VTEKRDCPGQNLLDLKITDSCVLLALSCYLKSKLTTSQGDSYFLYDIPDSDDEPQKSKALYRHALGRFGSIEGVSRNVATSPYVTDSLKKFPATWATEHVATDPK